MFNFAAFVPHPPIIIPEIGQDNIAYCNKTIKAMQNLAKRISKKNIDTIIFISPHTVLSPIEMTISHNNTASGDFRQFNNNSVCATRQIDLNLAKNIHKNANKLGVKSRLFAESNDYFIDHGVLVPLYYLQDEIPTSTKIIIIGYSLLSDSNHNKFGKAIFEAINTCDENIAVIASGDLSHRIFEPGSEFIGKKFDDMVVNSISGNRIKDIIKIDPYLREEAGECGYRSLLILLSSIENVPNKPEVLSYEAPFGVGYLVADFNI